MALVRRMNLLLAHGGYSLRFRRNKQLFSIWVVAMIQLAIVYFSATGTTEKLARAIERGASPIAEVTLCRITGQEIISGRFQDERLMQAIDAAAGVAFGSPTYMGGASAQFKAFADASSERWSGQLWAGKVAAGFTTGVCAGGDQLHTLTYFSIFAAQTRHAVVRARYPGGRIPQRT